MPFCARFEAGVGLRAEHFSGLTKSMLKRLLKMRFGELKKDRAAEELKPSSQ
jgi:hypothetical protein